MRDIFIQLTARWEMPNDFQYLTEFLTCSYCTYSKKNLQIHGVGFAAFFGLSKGLDCYQIQILLVIHTNMDSNAWSEMLFSTVGDIKIELT